MATGTITINKLWCGTEEMSVPVLAKAVYKGNDDGSVIEVFEIYAGADLDLVWKVEQSATTQYGTPSVTSIDYDTVRADGTGGGITVYWSQPKYTLMGDTITDTVTITGSSTPSAVNGTAIVSGAGYSGGRLYGPNCGTNVTSRRTIYTITGVTYTANGISNRHSGNYNVYQEANVVVSTETIGGDPSLNISSDLFGVSAEGGTAKLTITSNGGTVKETYTSGESKQVSVDQTVTLRSTGIGSTLSTTTITGNGTATITFDTNDSEQLRTTTVTATMGSLTDSVLINQQGSVYSLNKISLVNNVPADGGTSSFIVESLKNNKDYSISTANVSISGISGATVSSVTADEQTDGYYSVTISVPKNTTTDTRTCTVTIAHGGYSSKTLSVSVTQNAPTEDPGVTTNNVTIKGTYSLGRVMYEMTVTGTNVMDSVDIRCAASKSLTATVYGSTNLSNVTAGTYNGAVKASTTSTNYLLVIYNGSIIASSIAMASSDGPEIIG